MADTSSHGAAPLTGRHNPFDDPRPKQKKGLIVAMIIALFVHALLALYLWKSKFEPSFK